MNLERTPLNISNPKRKLDLEDSENDPSSSNTTPLLSSAKRVNQNDSLNKSSSLNKFEVHMYEAEAKANITKIAALEQELMAKSNEKKRLETEFDSYKEKKDFELESIKESKQQLEKALKNAKTNESFLNGELDHIRKKLESLETVKMVDKDKEVDLLQTKIVTNNEENAEQIKIMEKEIKDSQLNLESKSNEIEYLKTEIQSLNEQLQSFNDLNKRFDQIRQENCLLQNRIKDLELKNSNLVDNTQDINKYMHQSNMIEELERQNRKFKSEIDFLKANQEKSHLYQEELLSKVKQAERYEAKIVKLELENEDLKDTIKKSNETSKSFQVTHQIEDHKEVITELNSELVRLKEKSKQLEDNIKSLKEDKNEKESMIDDLQKRVTRLNTERNGYKNIIDSYDAEKGQPESLSKTLYKRIDEMELILNEYKKSINDSNELKLSNNALFQLDDNSNKSVEVQVNLSAEIYANYEKKIEMLKKELEVKKNQSNVNNAATSAEKELFLNETMDIINLKNNASDAQTYRVLSLELELKNEKLRNETIAKNIENKMKTEFSRKAMDILRSVRNLVGFKITFNDDRTISLNSIFNHDCKFLFKIEPDYKLSLMNADSATLYPTFCDLYLASHDSIPLYLNAINLDMKGFKLEVVPK